MSKEIMSNGEYHSKKDYLSASGLKKFAVSPAHYKHYIEQPVEETAALIFGSAVHALIEQNLTGEPVFDKEFFILNELDHFTEEELLQPNFRRKKEYQTWKKSTESDIRKPVDESVKFIVDKLFKSTFVKNTLLNMDNAECEPSYFLDYQLQFIDNPGEVKLRTRPDYINHELKYIVDYKTMRDEPTDDNCMKEIRYRYYWLQAALYTLIVN